MEKEDVRRIGVLAHIELTEEELEVLTSQLSEIINYMSVLREIDIASMPRLPRTNQLSCPLRSDKPEPSSGFVDVFLDRQIDDDGCLLVPSVVAAK